MAFPFGPRRGERSINAVCGSLFPDLSPLFICNSNVFLERTLSAWYLPAFDRLFCFSLGCNDFWYWLQICALAMAIRGWKLCQDFFPPPQSHENYCQNWIMQDNMAVEAVQARELTLELFAFAFTLFYIIPQICWESQNWLVRRWWFNFL